MICKLMKCSYYIYLIYCKKEFSFKSDINELFIYCLRREILILYKYKSGKSFRVIIDFARACFAPDGAYVKIS